jgi:hypothetical protein
MGEWVGELKRGGEGEDVQSGYNTNRNQHEPTLYRRISINSSMRRVVASEDDRTHPGNIPPNPLRSRHERMRSLVRIPKDLTINQSLITSFANRRREKTHKNSSDESYDIRHRRNGTIQSDHEKEREGNTAYSGEPIRTPASIASRNIPKIMVRVSDRV